MSISKNRSQLRVLRERRRLVLDKWADLTACDLCQARKVKCIRLDAESKDCESCQLKRVPCENLRQTNFKYKKSDSQSLILHKRKPRKTLATVSYQSTENGLHRLELSESFMADLLASFFEHSEEQAPYVNYMRLRMDFEFAGRRLQQLDPLTEPLILAMCASSSQYSNSRLLLGASAPDMEGLHTSHPHPNLVQFGLLRQALCERLARQAVELIDARGLFRKASPRSIQVLMMITRVMRHPAPLKWKGLEDLGDTGRPFVATALEHIRTLYSRHGAENVDIGGLQWPLVIGDGSHSAINGRRLLVSNDDLKIFPYMSGLPAPSPELVRRYCPSSEAKEFLLPLLAIASELVRIFRKVAQSISIPLANNRHVAITVFLDQCKEVRASIKTLLACQQVAKEMEASIAASTLNVQKQAFGASMVTSIRLAPLSPALLMPALHKQFEIYKQRYRSVTDLESGDGEEDSLRDKVNQEIEMGLVESLFIVTDAIRGMEGKDKVASLTRQTSLYVPIQQTLTWYFDLAYDIPTIEQNGLSSSWTDDAKSQTLLLLIDALKLQTWAWSDREVEGRECEYRYKQYCQALRERRSPSSAQGDDSSPATSSTESIGHADSGEAYPATINIASEFWEAEWGLDYTDLWSKTP